MEKANKKQKSNRASNANKDLVPSKPAFKNAEKAKKKSKHGKKNWRKNIDVSDFEKQVNQENQQKLIDQQVQSLKDEDLFVMDLDPVNKKSFLNKKTKRAEKGKISKNEERKIKRVAESIAKNGEEERKKNSKTESYDLWVEDNNTSGNKLISFPKPQFPKVPIPHPGQSYNPSRDDLGKLLHKVADLNKYLTHTLEEPTQEPVEQGKFISDDEEDEEEITDAKISNNPPVDDFTQRKTKKEKKRDIQKKLNQIKEMELKKRKENRIKLAHEKSLKRIEKERMEQLKQMEEKEKLEKQKEKEKEEMIKIGVIEDADLLKDFNVKKAHLPLRKMKTNDNIISERFDNILKRNVLGEYSNQVASKKKRIAKLNKMKYKDFNNNGDYGFSVGDEDKLKIFE